MKKLTIALLACASFNAMASHVGLSDSNSLNGNVNLECTSKNGEVLEVDGELFPKYLTIQSDDYALQNVKNIDGWKVYYYQDIVVMGGGKNKAVGVKGDQVNIQDVNGVNYSCK